MAASTTFGQRQKSLQALAEQLTTARSQATQFANQLRLIQTNLDNTPVTLKAFFEDIAADAQANPENSAYKVMQDAAQILLAESEATSTYIQALIEAFNSVKPL